jgi:hypothetical protein
VEAAASEPNTYLNAETRQPLNTQHHRRLCLSTRHVLLNCRSSLHWNIHFTSSILKLLKVAGRHSLSWDCTLNCSNNKNSDNNDTKSRILRAKDSKWKERLHNKLMDFERTVTQKEYLNNKLFCFKDVQVSNAKAKYVHSLVDCVWNVMAHAQKPEFVFRRNGRVNLNRQGRQFSRLLTADVCASAVVMLDTPSSEVAKGNGYPLHSPVSPSLPLHASPCAITFQLDPSTLPVDESHFLVWDAVYIHIPYSLIVIAAATQNFTVYLLSDPFE